MQKEKRFLVCPGTQSRVDRHSLHVAPDEFRENVLSLQQRLQKVRAVGFVSRRIRSIDAQVIDEIFLRLGVERIFFNATRTTAFERRQDQEQKGEKKYAED